MGEQIGSASDGVMAGTPREVVVYGSAEGFTQKVVIGPHRLVADEPADMGGADEGPTHCQEVPGPPNPHLRG